MKYYYLNEDKEPIGPHSREELIDKFSDQEIRKDTLVAEDGGSEWIEFISILNSPVSHSNPPRQNAPSQSASTYIQQKGVSDGLLNGFIYTLIGFTFLGTFYSITTFGELEPELGPGYLIFLLVSITSVILWGILHHRCWSLLPVKYRANITPGKAVGFMFIPFYNMFWIENSYGELEDGVAEWARAESVTPSMTTGVTDLPVKIFRFHYAYFAGCFVMLILDYLTAEPVYILWITAELAGIVLGIMGCIYGIKMYKEIVSTINLIENR